MFIIIEVSVRSLVTSKRMTYVTNKLVIVNTTLIDPRKSKEMRLLYSSKYRLQKVLSGCLKKYG